MRPLQRGPIVARFWSMKWKTIIWPSAAAMLGVGGCMVTASGPQVTESRSAGAFTNLRLEGAADVEWKQGSPVSVVVEGAKEAVAATTTNLEGDTLVVSQKPGSNARGNLKVKIQAPVVKSFEISGVGNLDAKDLECDALTVRLLGTGNATLAGNARSVDLSVSGTGNIKAHDLKAVSAKVAVSGVGHAEVNASGSLSINVSGVGGVEYCGRPKISSETVSGIGTVTHTN